jgi:hypothetical protein
MLIKVIADDGSPGYVDANRVTGLGGAVQDGQPLLGYTALHVLGSSPVLVREAMDDLAARVNVARSPAAATAVGVVALGGK